MASPKKPGISRTAPQHRHNPIFTDFLVFDNAKIQLSLRLSSYGLCLINQRLPAYEVLDIPRHEVAITLLRAVAFVGSRTEMQTTVIGAVVPADQAEEIVKALRQNGVPHIYRLYESEGHGWQDRLSLSFPPWTVVMPN